MSRSKSMQLQLDICNGYSFKGRSKRDGEGGDGWEGG